MTAPQEIPLAARRAHVPRRTSSAERHSGPWEPAEEEKFRAGWSPFWRARPVPGCLEPLFAEALPSLPNQANA